jgi:drug/metabolite transporter (DMT)-like permease
MYQQISEFLTTVPFFNSPAYGIIAMIIVGSSWCLVGLVMGDAPKKGIEPSLVQLGGALFSTVMSLCIMLLTSAYSTSSVQATFWTCFAYFTGSCLNFVMLQYMSKAMQLGPNGIIWSIIQSALVFPFIVGILCFDVQFSFLRGVGIIALLTALGLFALTKNNAVSSKENKWKLYAFLCLAIAATQQNITTMPSYFKEAHGVPSIVRSLAAAGGTLAMAIIWNLFQMNRERWILIKSNIRNKTLWKYIGALQFFSLLFAYTLFYPGMNVMADHGMGAMCYPMMVGSCIISFTLSSIWILKEKIRPIQFAALIVCTCGLILICTKA